MRLIEQRCKARPIYTAVNLYESSSAGFIVRCSCGFRKECKRRTTANRHVNSHFDSHSAAGQETET